VDVAEEFLVVDAPAERTGGEVAIGVVRTEPGGAVAAQRKGRQVAVRYSHRRVYRTAREQAVACGAAAGRLRTGACSQLKIAEVCRAKFVTLPLKTWKSS